MTAAQKIANRITLGLLLAALIIGAAMLVQVDTSIPLWRSRSSSWRRRGDRPGAL